MHLEVLAVCCDRTHPATRHTVARYLATHDNSDCNLYSPCMQAISSRRFPKYERNREYFKVNPKNWDSGSCIVSTSWPLLLQPLVHCPEHLLDSCDTELNRALCFHSS
jgi:hypothetical protein